MSRIISPELNKKLRTEYKFRFFALLFFMLSIVSFANITMISSSYVLLSVYENIYTRENSSINKNLESVKENEKLNSKISQVYALAQKIPSNSKEDLIDINIAKDIFDYAGQSVSIDSMEIMSELENSKVTLRGSALTRDSLLLFQEKIKSDSSFKDFNLPIEAITKQKDIVFNVTFTHHEN